jgi:hypothetical protein
MKSWQQKRFKEEWRGSQRTSIYWRERREGSRSLLEAMFYPKRFLAGQYGS